MEGPINRKDTKSAKRELVLSLALQCNRPTCSQAARVFSPRMDTDFLAYFFIRVNPCPSVVNSKRALCCLRFLLFSSLILVLSTFASAPVSSFFLIQDSRCGFAALCLCG